MYNIKFQGDFAYVYFSDDFYSQETIRQTLEIYKEFIEYQISKLGRYIIVKVNLKDKDFKLEEILKELVNYVIANEYKKINNNI